MRVEPLSNRDKYNINAKINYQKPCNYCGTQISFYVFEPNKKICSVCARANYRNDLYKFKELLQRKIKEVEV